jgi:hypothetical protein
LEDKSGYVVTRQRRKIVNISKMIGYRFDPPKADKGLIPRCLRRYNAFEDTPLLCGGVVHYPCSYRSQNFSVKHYISVFFGVVRLIKDEMLCGKKVEG